MLRKDVTDMWRRALRWVMVSAASFLMGGVAVWFAVQGSRGEWISPGGDLAERRSERLIRRLGEAHESGDQLLARQLVDDYARDLRDESCAVPSFDRVSRIPVGGACSLQASEDGCFVQCGGYHSEERESLTECPPRPFAILHATDGAPMIQAIAEGGDGVVTVVTRTRAFTVDLETEMVTTYPSWGS